VRISANWNAECLNQGVLRITTITNGAKVVLRLEGRLVGPWVKELEKDVSRSEELSLPLEIDVWDLTYADLAGERVLSRLHKKGALFKGKAPYAEYLFRQLRIPLVPRPARSSDDQYDPRNSTIRTRE
jgi:hypothetical protein